MAVPRPGNIHTAAKATLSYVNGRLAADCVGGEIWGSGDAISISLLGDFQPDEGQRDRAANTCIGKARIGTLTYVAGLLKSVEHSDHVPIDIHPVVT